MRDAASIARAGRTEVHRRPLQFPELMFPAINSAYPARDLRGDLFSFAGWFSPQWNGNDGAGHVLMALRPISAFPLSYIVLFKHPANILGVFIDPGGGGPFTMIAVDAVNFAAGSWHFIAGRISALEMTTTLDGNAPAITAGPIAIGDEFPPAGAAFSVSPLLPFPGLCAVQRLRLWRELVPGEAFSFLWQNERGIYGV